MPEAPKFAFAQKATEDDVLNYFSETEVEDAMLTLYSAQGIMRYRLSVEKNKRKRRKGADKPRTTPEAQAT